MQQKDIKTFGDWVNFIVDGNFLFKIPSYQRTYAWDVSNVETLLKDIQNNKDYFLGFFLLEQKGSYLYLVDGQQRFTTLYMLFHILNKKFPKKLFLKNSQQEKIDLENLILYQSNILRLSLQEGQNDVFFREMLASKKQEIEYFSQQNLQKAYDFLCENLNKLKEEEAQNILDTVSASKILLQIENNSGTAMQIFELLNDRGKKLTNLESLKTFIMHRNYLLCKTPESCNEYQKIIEENFAQIYKYLNELSNRSKKFFDEDDILRYYYIAFGDWKKDEYVDVKEKLKQIFYKLKTPKDIEIKTKEIVNTFKIMHDLIEKIYNPDGKDYLWLKNLYLIQRIASFYPLLISLYNRFPQELDKACNYLEVFAFRAYYLLSIRTDAGISKIYALARNISSKQVSKEDVFKQLKQLIIDYTAKDTQIKEIENTLEDADFYENFKNYATRYLLIKYENYRRMQSMQKAQEQKRKGHEIEYYNKIQNIMGDITKESLSVEHIIAQDFVKNENEENRKYLRIITKGSDNANESSTKWWQESGRQNYLTNLFGDNFLHCLGNLVISQHGANAAKGKVRPETKDWSGCFVSQNDIDTMIKNNQRCRTKNKWKRNYPFTVDEINERKKNIIKFINEYWLIETEDIEDRAPLI